MKKVYFDNNVWNGLVTEAAAADLINKTRDARDGSAIQIVGSFPLLEEIIATAHKHPTKAKKMRKLAFDLIEHRWMREIVERIGLEIDQGGKLPEHLLYLPREDRRKIGRFTQRDLDASEIADQVHALTSKFKADEETARREVADKFGSAPGSADVRDAIGGWFESVDVDDWARGALSPEHRGALERTGLNVSEEVVPSLWLFVRFKMARIRLCVGENRRIDGSDLNDARHYACGAYFDVLVTEDQRFAQTCALIPETPFEPWPLERFANFIKGL